MRFGRFEFKPALIPTVAAICALAALVLLGLWQLERAGEKLRLQQQVARRSGEPPVLVSASQTDEEALRFRRAVARGAYDGGHQFLLDNRTDGGFAGYHVLTPLRLTGSGVGLMVNRGWVPLGPSRQVLPDIRVDGGPVQAEGSIWIPAEQAFVLGATGYEGSGWPRVVQRVDLPAMERQLGYGLLPYALRLAEGEPHGYLRAWHAGHGIGPERHRGYAVQWFSLAAALVVIYGAVNLKRAAR